MLTEVRDKQFENRKGLIVVTAVGMNIEVKEQNKKARDSMDMTEVGMVIDNREEQ